MQKISIIGGDSRMRTVFDGLKKHGYTVDTIGLFDNDTAELSTSQVLLLPVPTTRDGVTVFCPLTNRKILLTDIEKAAEQRLVLSGNHNLNTERCIDYCALDSYSIKNAVPTAEGAIAYAIQNTPFTLWKSRCLVIGFGRVGKVLANRLKALGCNLTVSARNPRDFALLSAMNYEFINTSDAVECVENFDIIFNTIDVPVLNGVLERCKNTLIIDLSTKGAFYPDKANNLGINAVKLPALPGKTAPLTAGKILTETVLELIAENT